MDQAKAPNVGTNARRHSQAHPTLLTDSRPKAAAMPFRRGDAQLQLGDSLELAASWPAPTVIVSDGPYGLGSYPGDPTSSAELPDWYEPHVRLWAAKALPETTLWFWNSEIGWARVHPVLEQHGWQYRACHVWDKGTAHIAGNANTKTLRQFPIVTEVCVQYVRRVEVDSPDGPLSLKAWLRREWVRAGLPLYAANAACGVRNAATRKYLTQCDLWYFPPPDAFERMADHANRHGRPEGRPYYSLDGDRPLTGDARGLCAGGPDLRRALASEQCAGRGSGRGQALPGPLRVCGPTPQLVVGARTHHIGQHRDQDSGGGRTLPEQEGSNPGPARRRPREQFRSPGPHRPDERIR